MYKQFFYSLAALSLFLINQTSLAAPHYNVNDYYQVYKDGRIYIFDDFATYDEFNKIGETSYRLTRIGAGPNGETIVFGLQSKDKEMSSGIGSADLYDGKAEAIQDGFYGEVVKDGRIYVFSEWVDLQDFLSVGEATFRFTEIGAGPNGETVIYVLNKNNKQQKPTSQISEFKRKHKK